MHASPPAISACYLNCSSSPESIHHKLLLCNGKSIFTTSQSWSISGALYATFHANTIERSKTYVLKAVQREDNRPQRITKCHCFAHWVETPQCRLKLFAWIGHSKAELGRNKWQRLALTRLNICYIYISPFWQVLFCN